MTFHEKAEMTVQIIDRQYHEQTRTYVLPGYAVSNGNSNLNCLTPVIVLILKFHETLQVVG